MEKGKKEIVYSFGLNGISKIFTYLLFLVLANFYAVSSYGEFSFVFAIFNFLLLFCFLGLPETLVPWIIKKEDTTSVSYLMLVNTIFFVILGLFLAIGNLWILPLILSLPFLLILNLGFSILRSDYKYHLAQLFNLIAAFFTFIVVFLFKDLDKWGITTGYFAGFFLSSLGIFLLTKKKIRNLFTGLKIRKESIKKYAKKALIVSLIAVSFRFLGWLDLIILGFLSNFEETAKYNVASQIANIVKMVPFSIALFLLTRSSELNKIKEELSSSSENVLNRSLRISYFISVSLSVFIVILLNSIIKIFFKKYEGIEFYIIILLIGVLYFSIYYLVYVYSIGKSNPEKAIFPIIFAGILNIILDIILIPYFGVYGICFATLIAHFFAFIYISKKFNLPKYFLFILPISFIPLFIFFMGYYGIILLPTIWGLLFITKLINLEDIKVIKEAIFNRTKSKETD